MIKIEITGIDEIARRFRAFPDKYQGAWRKTMEGALYKIWEIVGKLGYPKPPPTSTYRRTGTLGRTLGIGLQGAQQGGKPDIFEVKHGSNRHEASYGTRLGYAPYVIGERQAWMHKGRWWTLPGTVARKAVKEIEKLFQIMVDEMARWLDGKGL